MNNQYEIEFEKPDPRDWYYDQSFKNGAISSGYTPHGIRCIDGQYADLIRNMHQPIEGVFSIKRRREICISPRNGEKFEGDYKEFYEPVDLDNGGLGFGIRVIWENGHTKDFFYGETRPYFDPITRKTDPTQLKKDIIDCPNLHVKIKENLLSNLKNYKTNINGRK